MLKVILMMLIATASGGALKSDQGEEIRWMTPEQVMTQWQKEPRPILVDLYTDWCGWCKKMDKVTYADKRVAAYINRKYYAMKFNAEQKQDVMFNSKKFSYVPAYKANEFAVHLTGGQLQYPTTVFLSSPSAAPAPLAGYLVPKDIEAPLKFFGERQENRMSFPDFRKAMRPEWSK